MRLATIATALLLAGCQSAHTQARKVCDAKGWDTNECRYEQEVALQRERLQTQRGIAATRALQRNSYLLRPRLY